MILLGIGMLEYDVLAFVVGVILASDYILLRLLGIFVKMVLEIYLGLMAYLSIFGVLTFIAPFKDYNGAQPSAAGSGGGGGGTSAGGEYVASDAPGDVIQITNVYSRTGSEMSTNAGHFYF